MYYHFFPTSLVYIHIAYEPLRGQEFELVGIPLKAPNPSNLSRPPSHLPQPYPWKPFSLSVVLARWRLADLPRLLAVDSRLSDRTVVRSRGANFVITRRPDQTLSIWLTLTIARQNLLGPQNCALLQSNIYIYIFTNPNARRTLLQTATSRQRGVTWESVARPRGARFSVVENKNCNVRFLRSDLSSELVLRKVCVNLFESSIFKICQFLKT